MGFSLAWFGVQGIAKEKFLEVAGYEDTGEPDDYFEAETSGGALPGGWYVIVTENADLAETTRLAKWSLGGRLIAVLIDEDSMNSLATEWVDGHQRWSIFHDGSEGGDKLEVSGELPVEFEEIRDGLPEPGDEDADDETDYVFDVPIDVAAAITGFRHDSMELDEDQSVFTALEEV